MDGLSIDWLLNQPVHLDIAVHRVTRVVQPLDAHRDNEELYAAMMGV
jgi:hypothetical protein